MAAIGNPAHKRETLGDKVRSLGLAVAVSGLAGRTLCSKQIVIRVVLLRYSRGLGNCS